MKPPKTRFEAFRINNRISVSKLYRAAILSSRTVDLMRRGSNTTIDSIRSITRTFGELLGREVTADELFDLSAAHQPQKVVASFDLPGKRRRGVVKRKMVVTVGRPRKAVQARKTRTATAVAKYAK